MASINLITGTPGSGKTLYAVSEVVAKFADPQSGRIVYNAGINGLAIPGVIDCEAEGLDVRKWHEWAPPNAIIVVDECQRIWRARSVSAQVPPEVAAMETIRHGGVEMWLITQHPNLLDANIRRLVGRHIHVRRVWGMARAVIYEWDHCSDPGRVSNSIKRTWSYPKKAYRWYKSAEVHNKAGGRIPVALWILIACVVALPFVLYVSAKKVSAHFDPEQLTAPVKRATGASGSAAAPVAAPPASSPAPVAVATAASAAPPEPVIVGCIRMGPRCECIDDQGRSVEIDLAACQQSAERGGVLVAYRVARDAAAGLPGASSGEPRREAKAPEPERQGPFAVSFGGNPRAHILGN